MDYNQGNKAGDMSPKVEDYQTPAAAYSQSYDQAPLKYVERFDKRQVKTASKIRSQKYMNKYDS